MTRQAVEAALQAWRDAERRLEEAKPGSPEETDTRIEVEEYHARYDSAVAEAEVPMLSEGALGAS